MMEDMRNANLLHASSLSIFIKLVELLSLQLISTRAVLLFFRWGSRMLLNACFKFWAVHALMKVCQSSSAEKVICAILKKESMISPCVAHFIRIKGGGFGVQQQFLNVVKLDLWDNSWDCCCWWPKETAWGSKLTVHMWKQIGELHSRAKALVPTWAPRVEE